MSCCACFNQLLIAYVSLQHHLPIFQSLYYIFMLQNLFGVVGWCDGAEKTSSAGEFFLFCIRVGQGPTVPAVGAGGVVWTFFSRLSLIFSFSLSL